MDDTTETDFSNSDIFTKVVESGNMILRETSEIRTNEKWIINHLSPTYDNVRSIHDMVFELTKTIKSMSSEIKNLKLKVDVLEDYLTKNNRV